MRQVVLIPMLAFAALAAFQAMAQQVLPTRHVHERLTWAGVGATSCEFVLSIHDEEGYEAITEAAYTSWALGWFSALDMWMRTESLEPVDLSEFDEYWPRLLDNCAAHPEDPFFAAAWELFKTLIDQQFPGQLSERFEEKMSPERKGRHGGTETER